MDQSMFRTAITYDRSVFDDAAALIAAFGDHACFEAAARAEKSRGLGNSVHFCRWREVERMIATLSETAAVGTVH